MHANWWFKKIPKIVQPFVKVECELKEWKNSILRRMQGPKTKPGRNRKHEQISYHYY